MKKSEIVMYLGFFLIISGFFILLMAPREDVKTDCFDSQDVNININRRDAINTTNFTLSMYIITPFFIY